MGRAPVDDESMGGMLRWQAQHRPDATAVICGDRRETYADLERRSRLIASGLLASGVQPADRVAVLLPNCMEYVEIYLAAALSGLIVVPINTSLTRAEIDYILDDSEAVLLIVSADLELSTTLPTVVVGGDHDGMCALIEQAPDRQPAAPDADSVFFQGYTSGTTGRPKGCVQTHGAFIAHYRRSFYLYRHDAHDVMLMPGPLFHEAPALFSLAQLFYGGTLLLLARFDGGGAVAAIERERATVVGFAVPTMLDRMLPAAETKDTSSLRCIIVAGAPLRPDTMDGVLRAFPTSELHEFYGGTEIGIITDIEHRADRRFGSSVGTPVPGCDVRLLDEHDRVVATGAIGQIYVRPIMMSGYHRRPEATASATRRVDGVDWLTLGDLGRLDADGHLHLVDRKSHMIITGGENVYPAEVESVLAEHPAVRDVAVIGLPDPDWGELVTAVITVAGDAPDLETLRAFAGQRLAGYKTPRRLEVVQDIPRTASGKILKHRLREQLA